MEKNLQRRRMYRLLLQPRFQLKYGAYFMTIAISSLVSSSVITLYMTMKILDYTRERPESEDIFKIFVGFVRQHQVQVIGIFTIMAFFYMLLAVIFTKRIVGPLKALVKHAETLTAGDYNYKTALRKGDDLNSLMVAMNDLSDSLKKKHQPKEFIMMKDAR